MNLVHSFVVVGLAVTILIARPEAAVFGRPLLVVRTYQAMPVEARDWKTVIHDATGILSRAGIDVDWVHCSSADSPVGLPTPCTLPYRWNEVGLRIVRRPLSPTRGKVMPLGDSLVDASTRSGTLATIYLEQVESLARTAAVSTNTVMARVIAHELGHLLLGTNTHSTIGLMRPAWTAEELVRNRPRDWMLSADEGQHMRQGLLRRSELDGAVASMPAGPNRAGL